MAEEDARTELEPAAYAGWFESDLGRRIWEDERRALYEVMGEVAARHVLDVGSGDGRLARELTERGAHVVALDRSEAMLRAIAAADDGRPSPTRVLGDALELPFPDESFDLTVAVTVLCFIDRATGAVRELARVTKPGGIVLLGELGRWSLWALARRLRARTKGGIWSHARFRTAPELRKLLAAAGVEPGEVRGAVFYPSSLLTARLLGWADPWLGRRTTVGAAFLSVAGAKPGKNGQK